MSRFADEVARAGAAVPPGLVDWVRGHRLDAVWTSLVVTTTTWIASAAPPWATPAQRALACMDLGTCFFVLDDADHADTPVRCDDLERVAAGEPPAPDRPVQAALADLVARLAATGAPLEHYRAVRVRHARAVRARHALRLGQRTTTTDDYLALRAITIYVEPWLALWEVLGGFTLTPAERGQVAPALGPATRWQVLENDRLSVERDLAAGTPNLVALLAAERGVAPAEAAAALAARADDELAAYRAATRALRAAGVARAVEAYLATLDQAIAGAVAHYRRADPARYQPPA